MSGGFRCQERRRKGPRYVISIAELQLRAPADRTSHRDINTSDIEHT
jgi:hypothetical protein